MIHPFPHIYKVAADTRPGDPIVISSEGLEPLITEAPAEFGGPGDKWSPETMLVGAVANCFDLTFRSIARASKFEWLSLRCDVTGVLDKPEGKTRFTRIEIRAKLVLPAGADTEKARKLMQKAEDNCLVTQSLNAELTFEADVQIA